MGEQEVTLKLTVDKLNVILNGLANLPYGQVFQLVDEIKAQANAQLSQTEAK